MVHYIFAFVITVLSAVAIATPQGDGASSASSSKNNSTPVRSGCMTLDEEYLKELAQKAAQARKMSEDQKKEQQKKSEQS